MSIFLSLEVFIICTYRICFVIFPLMNSEHLPQRTYNYSVDIDIDIDH